MKIFLSGLAVAFFLAAAPAQVVINECYTGTSDTIEIANLGSSPVNLTGWRVEYGGLNTALVWTPGTFTFPAVTLNPDQTAVLFENAAFPPVAAGSQNFAVVDNINWATAGPGATRGGGAVLVDASGTGVDMVAWYGAVPPSTFGATFNGTVNPTESAIERISRIDTDSPADWASLPNTIVSFGEINPGQVQPTETYVLTLEAVGTNSLRIRGVSDFPPLGPAQIYNIPSLQSNNGNGPLFGVGLDGISFFQTPFSPTGIIHTQLDPNGSFTRLIPGIPAGLHLEVVSIALSPTGIERISNVGIIQF